MILIHCRFVGGKACYIPLSAVVYFYEPRPGYTIFRLIDEDVFEVMTDIKTILAQIPET